MNNSKWPQFAGLCAQIEPDNLKIFDIQCMRIKELGYKAILSNIFFSIEPLGSDLGNRWVIFNDESCAIVMLEESRCGDIKSILDKYELMMPSCHFLQTLPPAGQKPGWIFDIHKRLLDRAAIFKASYITTHFAWMVGEQQISFMGDFVDRLKQNKISRNDYLEETVRRLGGKNKVMQESCIIYEHLCKEAISRGIKVSIETVPSPFDTSGAGGILQLIDMIGASNLGICIDSGHCNAVGLDVSEQIRIAGSKMFETHFHDNFGPQSNWSLSDMHNPVGIGTINWQKVILAIEQINYHGWVTFEQSDFETNIRNWHLFCEKAQKLR